MCIQWDLVCDQAWLTSMVSTIYMAGRLVGAMSCGFVSDGYDLDKSVFFLIVLTNILIEKIYFASKLFTNIPIIHYV